MLLSLSLFMTSCWTSVLYRNFVLWPIHDCFVLYYLHDDAVILVLGYRASPSTSELIQDILKLDALANFCSVQHFLDNSEAIARSLLLDLAGIQDILREGGDIGLFITLVHKVFFICWELILNWLIGSLI